LFYYVVTIIIEAQVSSYQVTFFYFQAFSYAFYIGLLKAGGIIFTAVGTFQAVDLCKRLLMQLRQHAQHFVAVAFLQQALIGLLVLFCLL